MNLDKIVKQWPENQFHSHPSRWHWYCWITCLISLWCKFMNLLGQACHTLYDMKEYKNSKLRQDSYKIHDIRFGIRNSRSRLERSAKSSASPMTIRFCPDIIHNRVASGRLSKSISWQNDIRKSRVTCSLWTHFKLFPIRTGGKVVHLFYLHESEYRVSVVTAETDLSKFHNLLQASSLTDSLTRLMQLLICWSQP